MYGLPGNPVAAVERLRVARQIDIDVLRPGEVRALIAAATSEQDAAIYLTAAFTGLRRGELLALRWRDVAESGAALLARADDELMQLKRERGSRR